MKVKNPENSRQLAHKTWSEILTLRNLFLYLVVVLMPVMGVYFFFYNIASQRYEADKSQLVRKLELQSARIPEYARPEFQLNDFFNRLFNEGLAQKSPQFIASFIDHIGVLYPETFLWLFWNEDFRPIPVVSRAIIPGQRVWSRFIESVIADRDSPSNGLDHAKAVVHSGTLKRAVQTLKRGLGDSINLESIRKADVGSVRIEWFGRPALLVWQHSHQNNARGGMLALAYLDQLDNNFWVTRMIKNINNYETDPLPVVAVNISQSTIVYADTKYSHPAFGQRLLDRYLQRSHNMFEVDRFLACSSQAEVMSAVRLISFADCSPLDKMLSQRLRTARFAVFLLLVVISCFCIQTYRSPKTGLDMRRRIALIFMTAVFLPLMSLVNIGRQFLHIEESRMIESALVEMRADLEGLELRFDNTPEQVQTEIFAGLKDLLGNTKIDNESLLAALDKSIEMGIIQNFVILSPDGTIEQTSWEGLHPIFRTSMSAAARAQAGREQQAIAAERRIEEYPKYEQIRSIFEEIDFAHEFLRPTRMALFTFQEENHYMMSVTLRYGGKLRIMFLQLPDYHLEKIFVEREFSLNRLVGDDQVIKQMIDGKTMIFYSTRPDYESFPKKVDRFKSLVPSFERAYELGVEESGQIQIADHGILYVIRTLESMKTKSYIPAVLMSTDAIYQRLDWLKQVFVLLVVAALLGALFLSFALASSLMTPIASIDRAIQAVGQGKLDLKLPYMGTDELGRLSQTFNLMIKGLREHEKMEVFVSEAVIEAIKDETGISGSTSREGQDIKATILFASIRNFTGIIEKYQPDVVFALLNEFLGGVEPIIRKNGGRVDKFIGDAVMAVFHHENTDQHAKNAVRTAVDMKNFVKNLNYKRQNQNLFTIEVGTGISTGQVMMGDIGSSTRKDLTVIGDEVNLASRLESVSRYGRHSRIVISEATNSLVRDFIVTELMPYSEVKGKKQAVKLYEIVKLKL